MLKQTWPPLFSRQGVFLRICGEISSSSSTPWFDVCVEAECTCFMNNGIHMVMNPCIPTISGTRTSSFHRPGRHNFHQAAKTLSCSASPVNCDQHATPSTLCRVLRHLGRNVEHMDHIFESMKMRYYVPTSTETNNELFKYN